MGRERRRIAMANDGPVVVVGGTGMLGGQVVTELLSRGRRVRALVRPGSDASRLEQAGAEIARGDMMDLPSLRLAMDGADAVVSTAAGYTRHSKGDTDEIDTIGNANLAAGRAAGRGPPVRADQHPDLRPDPARPALLAQEGRRGPAGGAGRPVRGPEARRLSGHDHPDGWGPVRQAAADVVRLRDGPAHLRAHRRPGWLSRRRRSTRPAWTASGSTSAGTGR